MDYTFKKFQKDALVRLLGIDKYKKILNMFNDKKVDLTSDEFTDCFNGFYKVRRGDDWQQDYYKFFNNNRNNKNISFDEILDYMYKKTGNIEASFSSKMLATINPKMPIWDQYVLKNLGIKVIGKTKEARLKNTKEVYKKIIDEVENTLKDEKIQDAINDFRKYFSDYDITDVKILDFILWNDRD